MGSRGLWAHRGPYVQHLNQDGRNRRFCTCTPRRLQSKTYPKYNTLYSEGSVSRYICAAQTNRHITIRITMSRSVRIRTKALTVFNDYNMLTTLLSIRDNAHSSIRSLCSPCSFCLASHPSTDSRRSIGFAT